MKAAKRGSVKEKVLADKKKKQLEKLKEQLKKLELQETDRDENKTIALGTSKLNYLDPRISVAWYDSRSSNAYVKGFNVFNTSNYHFIAGAKNTMFQLIKSTTKRNVINFVGPLTWLPKIMNFNVTRKKAKHFISREKERFFFAAKLILTRFE